MLKTQFNLAYPGSPGKTMDTTQHTVPDQHMSVTQLLQNHSRGLPIHAQTNEGHFFGTDVPNITDLTDLKNYKDDLHQRTKEHNTVVNDEIQASNKKKAQTIQDKKIIPQIKDETPPS